MEFVPLGSTFCDIIPLHLISNSAYEWKIARKEKLAIVLSTFFKTRPFGWQTKHSKWTDRIYHSFEGPNPDKKKPQIMAPLDQDILIDVWNLLWQKRNQMLLLQFEYFRYEYIFIRLGTTNYKLMLENWKWYFVKTCGELKIRSMYQTMGEGFLKWGFKYAIGGKCHNTL